MEGGSNHGNYNWGPYSLAAKGRNIEEGHLLLVRCKERALGKNIGRL